MRLNSLGNALRTRRFIATLLQASVDIGQNFLRRHNVEAPGDIPPRFLEDWNMVAIN